MKGFVKRMRKTKLFFLLLVATGLSLLISACSLASFSPTKEDPKGTVTKAYQKLNSLDNYHMSMDISSSMTMQNQNVAMVMKGEMDVQKKPVRFKNTMSIVSELAGKKVEQAIVQYMEESGDQFIIYSNINNQWMKQAVPKNGYNPLEEFNNYLQAITSATLKSEDANTSVFEVVASGSILREQIQKNLAAMGLQTVNNADIFKDLGDFTYNVTVDKKTGTISKLDIDLSALLGKIGNNLAEAKDGPAEQKNSIKEAFANMKVKTSVVLSQFNSTADIVIPEEAKK